VRARKQDDGSLRLCLTESPISRNRSRIRIVEAADPQRYGPTETDVALLSMDDVARFHFTSSRRAPTPSSVL
jgi:hypothetical protein